MFKLSALLLVLLLIIGCEEKLPVPVPPVDVAEGVLELTDDSVRDRFPNRGAASNGITFKVGIKNIFDETLEGLPYVNGTIKIWYVPGVTASPELVRNLDFHVEDTNDITVDVQKNVTVDVPWDQKNESGQGMWNKLEQKQFYGGILFKPLHFKASARVKFFRNLPYYHSDTIHFTIQYDTLFNISTVNFHAVEMLDRQHCWISGTGGTIYASYDNCQTFQKQKTGTLKNLNDIYFSDDKKGICIGDSGTFLYTYDGGTTWEKKDIHVEEDLNRLEFRTEEEGWITGDRGLILKTIDGGNEWLRQESDTRVNLYGMHFVGSQLCYAVGSLGTVLESSDGGSTWKAFRNNYTNCLYDMYSPGYSNQFIVGGSDGFINRFDRTTASWNELNNRYPEGINKMFFIGSKGWAAANKGAIFKILISPSGVFIEKQSTLSKNCVADVDFIDEYNGVAVGDGETVWITFNKGDSWVCMRNYWIYHRPWFKLSVKQKKRNP